jgi:S1-C subfamily serine protease
MMVRHKRRRDVLSLILLVGASLVAASLLEIANSAPARAATDDDFLRLYAVNINRTPKQSWPGYGVYLGRGVVITAAHVVGNAALTKPTVVIAGQNLEAKVIKEGEFDKVDLTLLSIDAKRLPVSLQMRLMPICQGPPRVGQDVVVAIPEATAHSHIMSAQLLPPDIRERFDTVISDVASTGNSGSGVFDAARQCLMGVMSRKIQQSILNWSDGPPVRRLVDLAKYFVPARQIREFLPPEYASP